MTKVYITKYALSTGIIEAELVKTCSDRMIEVRWPGGINRTAYFHGADWHESLELARARIKAMVKAKLKSLAKQQEKLAATLKTLERGGEISVTKKS